MAIRITRERTAPDPTAVLSELVAALPAGTVDALRSRIAEVDPQWLAEAVAMYREE
jgi:hypothetical protein